MEVRALDPSLGLYDAQSIVWARKEALGVSTDPPLPSIEELVARAAALEPTPLVIEAVWDGDTIHDWFVVIVAMVPTPAGPSERSLAMITSEAGPIAARATEIGQAIAGRLGVPFHFASPDAPDDRAPRWSAPRGA